MEDARLREILALASSGDEDVVLQVESEIALMPETRRQAMDRMAEEAAEVADSYAPPAERVDEKTLADLADDAGF